MNRALGLTFLVLLLTSCTSNVRINSDHQAGVDFSQFKNYRWRELNKHNSDSIKYLDNDIIDGRIRTAIDKELNNKKLLLTPEGPVDFLVSYSVTTQDKADVRNYNTYGGMAPGFSYGAYYGRGYRYSGVGFSTHNEVDVVYYKEGTLVLDIVSPDDDKLLWRASAEGRLSKNKSNEERTAALTTIIADMLSRFPPSVDD